MADERLLELASLLFEKTKTGEIAWEKTSFDETFQTSFPKYSVRIQKVKGAPTLFLFNEDGDLIEELSYVEAFLSLGSENRLNELFELARRKAMGVDQALDELLRELKTPREKKE
jgi:hypothetical protein